MYDDADEGPSAEDLMRFGGDSGYCPKCGEEVWDAAQVCPACGEHIGGDISSRPPVENFLRQRWILLVTIVVLIAFLIMVVL